MEIDTEYAGRKKAKNGRSAEHWNQIVDRRLFRTIRRLTRPPVTSSLKCPTSCAECIPGSTCRTWMSGKPAPRCFHKHTPDAATLAGVLHSVRELDS